jgi:hypothetical protein
MVMTIGLGVRAMMSGCVVAWVLVIVSCCADGGGVMLLGAMLAGELSLILLASKSSCGASPWGLAG